MSSSSDASAISSLNPPQWVSTGSNDVPESGLAMMEEDTTTTKTTTAATAATAGNYVKNDDDDRSSTSKPAISSVTTSTTEQSKMNQDAATKEEDALVRKKVLDTLRYIEVSEETQRRPKLFCKSFKKDGVTDWYDWTQNHYLRDDMSKPEEAQVFLTSYDFDGKDVATRQLLGWNEEQGNHDQPCWLKIPKPSHCAREIPEDEDNVVRKYFQHIKNDKFQDIGDDLNDIIPHLTHENLEQVNDFPEVKSFISSALEYKFSQKIPVSAYEKFHKFQGGTSELVAGFGHLRIKCCTSKDEGTIVVNGPLFEVPFEVSFHQGENARLEIRPTKDAVVTLNADVMAAIGGDNRVLMAKLTDLEKETKVARERLVHQHDARLGGQGAGQGDPLLLTAR